MGGATDKSALKVTSAKRDQIEANPSANCKVANAIAVDSSYEESDAAAERRLWRNDFTIQDAKNRCKNSTEYDWTVAVLCSGGCLDTLAAIRAGFKPIWSSEINTEQAAMFEDLTGRPCLGDTFGADVANADKVKYIKSGQPCPDYSCIGVGAGANGKTGWMFTEQVDMLLESEPWALCLEMSANAKFVNDGAEVDSVLKRLSNKYVVYCKVLQMAHFGDGSNRKRLFIVGFLRRLGQAAHEFKWPERAYTNECVATAREIAVPDLEVTDRYWNDNVIEVEHLTPTLPNWKHRLQFVARLGDGIGPAENPNAILSWEGQLNGQTTLNGGGQRPSLEWKRGETIVGTRLCTPVETVRAASLSDHNTEGYQQWAVQFTNGDQHNFLRKCVNNGVPQRTSVAIDTQVLRVLKVARARHDTPTAKWVSLCWEHKAMRSMLFDTGANGSINFRDVEPWLANAELSKTRFTVANKQALEVGLEGKLSINALNTGGHTAVNKKTQLSFDTTTADVNMELFSFDQFYQEGWGCILPPTSDNNQTPEIWKPATNQSPEVHIPLRYNWNGSGGFWMDYLVIDNVQDEHRIMLARYARDLETEARAYAAHKVTDLEYNQAQSTAIINAASKCTDVTDVTIAQHEDDRAIRGVKLGLKSEKQKMTAAAFHSDYGHLGSSPKCLICKLTKGSARKIYKKVDPHRETRPGYRFHMDTVTWSDRSREGDKFMTVLRCEGSDHFTVFCHYLRSDIVEMVGRWVEVSRRDPAYHDCRYKMISEIYLDNAGEWAEDSSQWKEMVQRYGINCVYSCPDRKESASRAERSVGIIEIVTKSLLMEANLPPWWWERACKSAAWLLNRFPTANLEHMSGDGDAVRPLEVFSRFTYSRRQIDRELSYFVMPGTPTLVQTTAKGSAIAPKTRWGIATGMYREQVIFMCPYINSEFRSKSFSAFKLKQGVNYAQFLGLPELKTSQKGAAIPADFNEKLVIQLPSADWSKEKACKEVEGDCVAASKTTTQGTVIEVKVAGDGALQAPIIKYSEPRQGLGGSVQVTDCKGTPIDLDQTWDLQTALQSADLQSALQGADPMEVTKVVVRSTEQGDERATRDNCYVHLGLSSKEQTMFDKADARKVLDKATVTDGDLTFVRACKSMKLPFEQHGLYRDWLMQTLGYEAGALPLDSYSKLKPGLKLPYPSGLKWRELVEVGSRKKRRANHCDADLHEKQQCEAEKWIESEVHDQQHKVRQGGKFCFNVQKESRVMNATAAQYNKMNKQKQRGAKKRTKAVATGREPNPPNMRAALEAEDCIDWVKSMDNEFFGLVEKGVFDLGYTQQQLLDKGITSKPVPCAPYFEKKYGADGEWVKNKTRIAIQGHPGNMQRGIHYGETFSATPKESTARLLCALVCLLNLTRAAFDITKAYCWADVPDGDRIALRYPEGFREFHPDTGEELFMILMKNLYGHPAAGRQFGKQRDAVLIKKFNTNGWTCTRTKMDPCLFVVTKNSERIWMLVHVDDCELVGDSQQVIDEAMKVCNTIWELTVVDSEYMLGVRRRLAYDDSGAVSTCELDMTAYCEGMHKAFEEHIPKGKIKDPVPPKLEISLEDKISPEESRAVLEAGYQCAIGMLLWAVRRVHCTGRLGVSLLCRVMAKPSWKAFNAAMHMIGYIYQNRTTGIRYTAGVNTIPLGMVDASNKPDRHDGKCQYGYVVMWMGASVMEHSKKLRHIGLSSEHNEYMAMAFANQSIVWIRQLLTEMGLAALVQRPTILLGDNKAANILSREDIVSTGNQYMYLPYHYNKEVQEEGFTKVDYVRSDRNISDVTTKAVDTATMSRLSGPMTGFDTRLITELSSEFYGDGLT